MITIKGAEEIHELLINNFGGSHGTRNFSGLDSALAKTFPYRLVTSPTEIDILEKFLYYG